MCKIRPGAGQLLDLPNAPSVPEGKTGALQLTYPHIGFYGIPTITDTTYVVTAPGGSGAGYYIDKTGTVVGNSSGRDNLFRVNLAATTGNVTIAAANNASVTGPLTIANGTTLTITATGRLAII